MWVILYFVTDGHGTRDEGKEKQSHSHFESQNVRQARRQFFCF